MEEFAKLMGDFDFNSAFGNIDVDMLLKMGELLSKMSEPDKNTELLLALKPHLSPEKQGKIDAAVKLSRMMSLLPLLKESGLLGDLF